MYLEVSSAGGYKYPKLFASYNGCDHDNSASWEVYSKRYASDLVSLSVYWSKCLVLMFQDRSALGIRAHRHCPAPVFENHRYEKAPEDKT